MSGGHFNYAQDHILSIIEELENVISKNDEIEYYNYSPETIQEFRIGLETLKRAYVYTKRIDWLLSADDGEDNFHKNLQSDLKKLCFPVLKTCHLHKLKMALTKTIQKIRT